MDKKNAPDMKERAQEISRFGDLVAGLGHKVNNSLMIIYGRVQLSLMRGVLDDKVKSDLKVIEDQCQKAKTIIDKLLKFSKPTKGNVKEIDLNATIKHILAFVEKDYMEEHNVKIVRDFDDAVSTVQMDVEQMREICMNLLSNSVAAMPEGGTITISTLKEGDTVRMDFKDSGKGIPEEYIKKIFDPFFTTKEKSMGLGLSVCYGLIEAHGGTLRHESKAGEGTTATVILPAAGI